MYRGVLLLVTYNVTDLCESGQDTATFTVTAPSALVISDVQSITVNACDYANQAALDTAFANWIAGFSVSGGCNPQATDISGLTAPVLCIGGATAVTYNVTDLCESGQDIATFTVTPASALVISDVANETIVAGTYTTQNDLDTAFATWLTNFTVSGGCNPQAQFAASYTAPALCGGSVSIEFNVTDLCESGQDIATFTVEGANPLIISDVQSITVNACDYTDQAALDTAFANWIAGFSVSGGVTPTGQFAASYSAPTLCTGGTTAVTYDVTDTCGSGQDTASFTVTPPTALVISDVQSITVNACDYTDQAALDTAFANWIAGFSVSGGCNPQATDISGLTAPVLCNGGATAVTYNVTDLCESGQDIATFTVTPASALVISDVQSITVNACDYANQAALDTAFANWIAGFSVSGGCNPQATDISGLTAPVLCIGGATAVTYNVTDLCESGQDIATFTVTPASALVISDVANETIVAGTYTTQNDLDTAFATWLTNFTVSGGCNPQAQFAASYTAPALCGGSVSIEFNVTDLCESGQDIATFTVEGANPLIISDVQSITVNACDYTDQAALDTAFANWIAGFSVSGGVTPTGQFAASYSAPTLCTGGTTAVTYDVTDTCGSGQDTASFTVTPPTAVTFDQINLPLDITVECDNIFEAENLTASTSCGNVDIVYNEIRVDGSCPFYYELKRTWTATDNCGTTISHTQTIQVEDTTAPELIIPVDITVECTADTSSDATGVATGSDSCGIVTITQSDSSVPGPCGNTVVITRTWTATDVCGNATSANQIITTEDTTPPVIDNTIIENIEIECGVGDTQTTLGDWLTNNAGATATDSCGNVTWSNNYGSDDSVKCDNGAITVVFTATDACGNMSLTTATYLIKDTDAPIISQQALNVTVECDGGGNIGDLNTWLSTNGGATATDSCSNVIWTNNYTALSDDCGLTGSAIVTFTATDACLNTSTSTATFTIIDSTPPSAPSAPSNITYECIDDVPAAGNLTGIDICGGAITVTGIDITDNSNSCNVIITRTWTFTDDCDNTSSVSQTITVKDTTAPILVLPANVSAECSDDLSPTAFGTATATDNCDSSPVVTFSDIRTDGPCPGTYAITRTWTATDACGNIATADQIVSTSDTTPPDFVETELPQDITVECSTVPLAATLTATDNCGTAEVTVKDTRTNGSCANNYVISRVWTATDLCGLTRTHIQTITVQDTTPPVFVETLPPTNLVVECDAVPNPIILTATDICGTATVSVSDVRTNGSCKYNYTLARTWTATDACGN